MDDLRELYQEVILDHGKRPRNLRHPEDANRHAHGYNAMCTSSDADAPDVEDDEAFESLQVLAGVRQFPVRVKCATLAWHTMVAAMNGQAEASSE